ncbi:carbohydrate ABC transporter membrane protein 1 (CUT1 family) [Halanaerobium saccharolyticum]|uniref:Carbohydrate ABC transporter membrane protein 1 (CUT1 family) n=1 Tax=Halanaerobium saccharolyticum TaxID=43595 RepID=A0A4R7YV15_9FIRM|nr:sugar ABC transporter permease [Halanaerobium saccharolyticum]RAK06312.1 carbohydrate ABC transporter membrane protein 1 (CUT1 family) [Halanaerobium saccharolyticum]TDW00791.1 carbohydrate ABC transporter membrane protein 1 (CUT1 family) [Halanaerobium saccharolyticum]TDX52433.1 carbohydrate ABC transporter membrane protein 1 (CUT1 family) [Halanaerobium saccharolyticum]
MFVQKAKSKLWIAWILVLPVLIIRGFTVIYPIFETIRISFYDVRLLRGLNQFVGLQNYFKVFTDPKVLETIEFTLIFVISSMTLHILLGVLLALILNMKFKAKKFLRTIVLIPWAMPMVVIGMAAKWGFNNEYGLVNDFIRRFVPNFELSWLIHSDTARAAVIAMDIWKNLPFFAILILAGLQFIPTELYEAAMVDGATKVQAFFKITLPLIVKNIMVLSIPFTMWRLASFDIVYSMTSGGPGSSTELIAYRITTEVFTNLNLGYGATLAVLLFIVMVVFSTTNLYFINKK